MIFDAVSRHSSGILSMESFASKMKMTTPQEKFSSQNEIKTDIREHLPDLLPTLREMEQLLIEEALDRAEGNQTIAGEMLGLSRKALNNRLRRSQENEE